MNRQSRVAIDERVCHGQPCIQGTRVLVSVVVNNVAAGVPRAQILGSDPTLTDEDIDAAIAFRTTLQAHASIVLHAIDTFGDERKAMHWLVTPLPLFNGRSPIEVLESPDEIGTVEVTLARIAHDIPS